MKNLIAILIVVVISSNAFSQKKEVADTTQKKDPKNTVGSQNDNKQKQDTAALHITPGASGVKRSIGYKFSSSTVAGDPGNGVFRFDKGVAADVKYIIADDIDIKGEDQTNWYSTWDKTTGAAGRGAITITDGAGKIIAVFNFTAVFTDATGFWKLPVDFISGSLPGNGSVCYYVFERIAHNKPSTGNVQGNQEVVAAAAVTTGAVVAAQAVNQPRTAPVNASTRREQTTQTSQTGQRTQTTQPTQSKPVTQTTQPTQSKPVTQTTQPTQSKPVTQTAQPTQSKPVAQTTQPVQTKPVTQAAVTTTAIAPAQKTQITQPSQGVQSPQQSSAYQSNQVTTQNNQFPVVTNIFENPGPSRRKWYRGIIEVGYGFGIGDYGINNFRFNFINAIKIGEFSSIGLGIGYRRLFADNNSAPYLVSAKDQIPVFLDLRTSFSARKLTPYLAVGVGGSSGSGSSETDKALFLFNASGGIWYNFSPRFAVFAGIAYEMQKLDYSDTEPFAVTYNKNAASISLNIGISF